MTRTRRHTGGRPVLGRREGGRDQGLDVSDGAFGRLRRGNSDGGHYRRLERRRMQERVLEGKRGKEGDRERRETDERVFMQNPVHFTETLNGVAAEDLHSWNH